jgi:hypothetical protein
MANRLFSKVKGLNKELILIAGRLEDDDTVNAGLGFSGANSTTGVYIVTLEDKYNALISCTATIQSTTGVDDYNVCIIAHDVTSAKTITLHVYKSDGDGTATLTDLGDTDEIHFVAVLQNSATPSV